MENKINLSAVELYARKAVKPFLDNYFNTEYVSGKDIIGFCQIEQVNYFILNQLFQNWQLETEKLKSPYFDFSNPQVEAALKTFMGQLSQHIKVSKEDFTPLLQKAIANTIYLTVAPISFLTHKFLFADKNYTEDDLKNLSKYIKIFPEISNYFTLNVNSLLGRSGAEIGLIISTNFGLSFADQVVEDRIMALFNEILPVLPSDFHYSEPAKAIVEDPVSLKKEEPKHVTINDLIGKENKSTVLHLHTKNKIVDIRSAMSINQKFMFIKELFKGDSTAFEGAMSLADGCDSYENSVNALIDAYSERFGWQIDSEEVNELFDLIGRKFYPENFAAN